MSKPEENPVALREAFLRVANDPEVKKVKLPIGYYGDYCTFGFDADVKVQTIQWLDDFREFAVGFRQMICMEPLAEIESRWPEDWWQAFRERWFPAWWLKRWPVKYRHERLEAMALYPELSVPRGETYSVIKFERFSTPVEEEEDDE